MITLTYLRQFLQSLGRNPGLGGTYHPGADEPELKAIPSAYGMRSDTNG